MNLQGLKNEDGKPEEASTLTHDVSFGFLRLAKRTCLLTFPFIASSIKSATECARSPPFLRNDSSLEENLTVYAYLFNQVVNPIVSFGDDFIFSVINLQQVNVMGGIDCIDNGVFVHKELEAKPLRKGSEETLMGCMWCLMSDREREYPTSSDPGGSYWRGRRSLPCGRLLASLHRTRSSLSSPAC